MLTLWSVFHSQVLDKALATNAIDLCHGASQIGCDKRQRPISLLSRRVSAANEGYTSPLTALRRACETRGKGHRLVTLPVPGARKEGDIIRIL